MKQFRVQPGDIFLTASNQLFGRGIRLIERMFSLDQSAKYNHAGIILAGDGETLESLWTVKRQNLYTAYAGYPVLVARCNQITQFGLEKAMQSVLSREGEFYPFLRIPLHALGLAVSAISAHNGFSKRDPRLVNSLPADRANVMV